MKLLVAGGAGFLGSHLCDELIRLGNHVIALDNFHTGRYENIEHLESNPNFELIEADIVDPIDMKVDGIFNFACPASPIQYQVDPVKTMVTNVQGSINLLNLALENKARILQASTSEVYGDALVHPQKESYWGNVNPIGIRACYDEGKRAAETLYFDYHRQYRVDIRVARIFNTFGPRMAHNDGRVVTNFISQALKNSPLTIYGDGLQTRSFCYVQDLIDGIIKLYFSEEIKTPVNLGNPSPVTMVTLANEIIDLCNSTSKLVFQQLPGDDPKDREPDIAMAMNLLGWEAKIGRREGLISTIEYQKSQKF
jgi:UDP-glucuronate decarboxylase